MTKLRSYFQSYLLNFHILSVKRIFSSSESLSHLLDQSPSALPRLWQILDGPALPAKTVLPLTLLIISFHTPFSSFLQFGHSLLCWVHSSRHREWNPCPHPFRVSLISSPSRMSSRQIEHAPIACSAFLSSSTIDYSPGCDRMATSS